MATESENVMKTLNKSFTGEFSTKSELEKEFGERLQTYITEQKWVKRPLALSPAICSQYGWKCIKPDLLECVTCTAKLCAHEPSIEKYEAYKACLDKLLTDLKESHRKHCPWPLTPSPENFVKMTPVPKEEALCQFLQRFKPCLLFKESIPQIKHSVLLDLGLSEQHISAFCKLADINSEEANHLGQSLVSLAATGWTLTSKEHESKYCQQTFLTCINCQRCTWSGYFSSVKLDMSENGTKNTSKENSESLDNDSQASEETCEPLAKRRKTSLSIKKGEPFDPLREHRPWCLWILSSSAKDKSIFKNVDENQVEDERENIPGWKIYMKSLLRNVSDSQDLSLKNSPSKERIRSVRNMLETWADVMK